MEENLIDKQSLIDSLQTSVDKFNTIVKKGNLGTNDIEHIKVHKINLSKQIKLLSDKQVINEEDQMNTSRLAAISAAKIDRLTDKGKDGNNGVAILILIAIGAGIAFYYFKTKRA